MSPHHQSGHCKWCGKPLPPQTGRGRRRSYCSHPCRQRAYEQRRDGYEETALVLSGTKASKLMDCLFELRCSAEDLKTAVSEGASRSELLNLADELVVLATNVEEARTAFRTQRSTVHTR